jgi:hypothetical protein
MFLHYVLSFRILYSAFPSVVPTLLDLYLLTIRPLPAYRHSYDQLPPLLPLLLTLLLFEVWFFLLSAAGLVSHSPIKGYGPELSIRHSYTLLPLFPSRDILMLLELTLESYFGAF